LKENTRATEDAAERSFAAQGPTAAGGRGAYGCQSMVAQLRRVLVRPPAPGSWAAWRPYGWRGEPDPARLEGEHEAFRALLADAGADVVVAATPHALDPDAIYVYDPALVTNKGAVMLRPGKEGRRGEVEVMAADFVEAGLPIAGRLDAPAMAEGGDTLWLDERTLLVGRGYRTNDEGIRQLAEALPGVDVVAFDLPHLRGAGEVLHLMSLLSPLDVDLAVAYPPLIPVRLMELLAERSIELVEVPDEEFETMGPNVLALSPRAALALEGNDETRRRMEKAGVDVRMYRGDEISRKGDGGPTCLTRPLLRS
jgi:dimethylargininase